MRPREIFLSHATADKELGSKLIRALEKRGLKIWFAPYRLVGSQKWHDEIGKALLRCDWFVLLLSESSVDSRWVKHELLFALNEAKFVDRIVPVLTEECAWRKLSWTLDAIQHVDFRPGFVEGMDELLRVWELEDSRHDDKPPNARPAKKRRKR